MLLYLVFLFILEISKTLQICWRLNLFCSSSCSLQRLKHATTMIPNLHVTSIVTAQKKKKQIQISRPNIRRYLKGFGVIFPILHTPFPIPLLHFLQLLRPVVAYSTQYLASDAIIIISNPKQPHLQRGTCVGVTTNNF